MWGNRAPALAFVPLLVVFAGCGVPIAQGLEDSDANRIVIALDRANIDALKETDPDVEGKFKVSVPRDDAARAILAMQGEELPRPKPAGVLDSLGKGSIVPSAQTEHAQFVAGLAGDLEKTLEGIDGVLSARVHLNIAAPEPFRDGPLPKTTASVLLAHRGSAPPITNDAVQRLVAGGVSGLAANDVAVISVSRAAPPQGTSFGLAHVGPIAVAPASSRVLQIALGSLVLLIAALAGMTLALYTRLVRTREAALKA